MAAKSASPEAAQILREIGFSIVSDDWEIIRLQSLLAEDRGIAVGVMYPGDHDPDGVPLLRAGDLSGGRINPKPEFRISPKKHAEYRRTELTGGELLISLVGNVGLCAIVPGQMEGWNTARAIAVLRFASPSDAWFVRYCLMSDPFQHLMRAWSTTTVQATLNLKEIRQIPLPWPPSARREAVVDVLKALDDKIELNRRMNRTLEATARALYNDWFVDFGPTRAKSEGHAPYLAPDIWSLFPGRFADEGTPDQWQWGTLADLAHLNPESWSRGSFPDSIQYVDLSNTKWGTIEAITPCSKEIAPSRAQRILRQGDTVVGTVRPGNGSYAYVSEDGLTGSTGFAVLRPKQPMFREIVYLASTSKKNIDRLSHLADGGAYPAVRPDVVLATEMIAGHDDRLIAEFSILTKPLIDRAEANKREVVTLTEVRDFLLPKLMSGEVCFSEVEPFA
jgi:type I restriction enzyme S subunit